MKRFTVPCDFNGVKHPFHVYIGEPHPKKHPLQFQAWWLSTERGGTIPQDVMDSFEKLFKISQENNVSFEDLCVYALGTAAEENEQAEASGPDMGDDHYADPGMEPDSGLPPLEDDDDDPGDLPTEPLPIMETAPPPASEDVPPPSYVEDVPPPMSEEIPAPPQEAAPTPYVEDVPPPMTESAPPPLQETAPPPISEDVPPPIQEAAPPPSYVEDVPPPKPAEEE